MKSERQTNVFTSSLRCLDTTVQCMHYIFDSWCWKQFNYLKSPQESLICSLCILHSVLETWSRIESEQKWDTGSLIQEGLLQTWHINALKVDFYCRNIWNGWIMVMTQNQMIIICLDSVMWSSKMHHFQHAADVIEHSKQNHQKKNASLLQNISIRTYWLHSKHLIWYWSWKIKADETHKPGGF